MSIQALIVSSSMMILAIIVIRFMFIHRLPKQTFVVLWAVAVLRLLTPLSIPSKHNIYELVNKIKDVFYKTSVESNNSDGLVRYYKPVLNQISNSSDSTVLKVLQVVWLLGAIGCSLYFLSAHRKGMKEYKAAMPIDHPYVNDWQQHQNRKLKRNIQIRQLDTISSPLTYGILRPVILLPKATDYSKEDYLEYILTHELFHIRRNDILKKWVLSIVLWIYWFNPIVITMYILANRDIELSCDEAVIYQLGAAKKSAYAMALINMEQVKSNFAPLCSNFNRNAVEERIKSIMKMKKTTTAGVALAFLLIVGTTSVFATQPTQNTTPATGTVAETTTQQSDAADLEPTDKMEHETVATTVAEATTQQSDTADLEETTDKTEHETVTTTTSLPFGDLSKFGVERNDAGQLTYNGEIVKYILDTNYMIAETVMSVSITEPEEGTVALQIIRDKDDNVTDVEICEDFEIQMKDEG